MFVVDPVLIMFLCHVYLGPEGHGHDGGERIRDLLLTVQQHV